MPALLAHNGSAAKPTLSLQFAYLTFVGIFSEVLYFTYGFEIRFFYFMLLLAMAACLLIGDWALNKYHVAILLYLYVSGAYGVAVGHSHLPAYLEQVVGITICSIYFYIFLRAQPLGLIGIFRLYAKFAYWFCILGLLIVPFHSLYMGTFMPVQGIMREPAHFASVVLPAVIYYTANAFSGRGDKKEAFVTFLAVALSRSATGFLGLMLGLALLLKNRRMSLLAIPLAISLLGAGLYAFEPHFRLRVDDTFKAAGELDVTGVNLSTYALLSNAYVSASVLQQNPVFGWGLGAHRFAHDLFIGDLPGSETWGEYMETNKNDANSLLLRTASELGLIGLLAEFFFIVKFFVRGDSERSVLSCAILTYFATKLMREGHWFSPEMYFFVWLYVMLKWEDQSLRSSRFLARVKPQLAVS